MKSFVSEVVFLEMPSRQRKNKAKRRANYFQTRDDVLESARACYKAEPEKKRAAERKRYHAEPEKKRAAERESYQAEPEKKRSAEHERYQAEPEKKRIAKRESYQAEPEKKRAAKRQRYWESPESACAAKRVRYGESNEAFERILPIKLPKGMTNSQNQISSRLSSLGSLTFCSSVHCMCSI